MSSNELLGCMASALIACAMGSAQAKTFDVCPTRHHDPIQQIYLFDGTPEELAYLAPDNDTNASNLYSLESIYDNGRFVNVRCKYKGGSRVDLKLKNRTSQCTFRKDKAGYGNLRCR